MSIVAIDTASRVAAWVVRTDAGGAVAEHRAVPGGELDRLLPGSLAAVLTDDVEAVVVLTGPGSYSGVRAGMAAALGVAQARHLPLHGIGNLAAIAVAAGAEAGERFSAVSDAGRGGVYIADFERADERTEQVSAVMRVDAQAIDGSRPRFATTAITGLATNVLDPLMVLAAAVPHALAAPALDAAGLYAVHAEAQAGQAHPGAVPGPPATGR